MAPITCDNRRRIDFQELLLVVRDAFCIYTAPGRVAPDTGLVLPSLCSRRVHGGVVPAALYLHVIHRGPRPAFRLADHPSFRADGHHHRGGEAEFHAPGNAHFRGLAGSVRPREVMVLCRTVCRTEGFVRWKPSVPPLPYSTIRNLFLACFQILIGSVNGRWVRTMS